MARVEKFTEHAIVNQLRHNLRQIKYSANVDIDERRLEQNYELGPDRGVTAYDYFQKRKAELYCYRRADVKVMAGWVVTAPKDLSLKLHDKFFQETYNFLEQRYGKENVILTILYKLATNIYSVFVIITILVLNVFISFRINGKRTVQQLGEARNTEYENLENKNYETEFLDIGDGIAISVRK